MMGHILGPNMHMEDPDEIPNSRAQSVPALLVAGSLESQSADKSVFFFLSLSISLQLSHPISYSVLSYLSNKYLFFPKNKSQIHIVSSLNVKWEFKDILPTDQILDILMNYNLWRNGLGSLKMIPTGLFRKWVSLSS